MPVEPMPNGWITSKCTVMPLGDSGEFEVVATTTIGAGELLVVWGGDIYPQALFDDLPASRRRHSIQIEEELYLVPIHPAGPVEYINHSCDPTAGLQGQIALVARRDITPGEPICYDYATSDGTPYDEFECHCGTANCRGRITGDDWQQPALWVSYAGHFSPYLQRRIDALKAEQVVAARKRRRVLAFHNRHNHSRLTLWK